MQKPNVSNRDLKRMGQLVCQAREALQKIAPLLAEANAAIDLAVTIGREQPAADEPSREG